MYSLIVLNVLQPEMMITKGGEIPEKDTEKERASKAGSSVAQTSHIWVS